jgi:hypothetical protein
LIKSDHLRISSEYKKCQQLIQELHSSVSKHEIQSHKEITKEVTKDQRKVMRQQSLILNFSILDFTPGTSFLPAISIMTIMKNNIATLFIAALCCLVSLENFAQDGNKKSDKRNANRASINTKQKTPVKIIQYIPGVWTLDQVIHGNKDIAANDTVAQNQTLEFNREGRYMSYSGNERIDSGAYRLNEDHAILYLASETDDKPHEWNVWFKEDGTMILKQKDGTKHGENFSYVYRRTSNASKR